MFIDMLKEQENSAFDLSSLKNAVLGGASCPGTVVMSISEKMKVKNIHNGYGITENSPGIALSKLSDSISEVASGYSPPLEHIELKIINQKGKLLPINTEGELCTRGYMVFMGYWNDKAKTDEAVNELKWFHTGDLAVMNENGCIKIVGRKKDIVIRGGENIYPREIEDFLHTHPLVLEAHVIGVPDARMGEELCAWLKIKDKHELNEQEIKDYCFKKISHFKIPKHIMFVEDFPKTASGKVQKFKMRESSIIKLGL